MISTIKVSNFRSIQDQNLELAPLTIIYGPNAAGKSSIFYALAVMKEILTDANRQSTEFFNFRFMNIGDFQSSIFRHDLNKKIQISVKVKAGEISVEYRMEIGPKIVDFYLDAGEPYNLQLHVTGTFPYPNTTQDNKEIIVNDMAFNVVWTGTGGQVTAKTPNPESNRLANEIAAILNKPILTIRASDIVPVKRGFTKPSFAAGNPVPFPLSEDEVAIKLASNLYADQHLSLYLEQIMDRHFSAKFIQQLGTISLTTSDIKSKQPPVEVVNDGFGVNQLIYLLGKTLNKETQVACIEEPEINLHPAVVRKLPKAFLDLVKNENKQLLISTHSETLMLSLQAAVARKEINRSDIVFYFVKKEDGITKLEKQTVNAKVQIKGGLKTYMDVQLEDIVAFIGKTDENIPEPKRIEDVSPADPTAEDTSPPLANV